MASLCVSRAAVSASMGARPVARSIGARRVALAARAPAVRAMSSNKKVNAIVIDDEVVSEADLGLSSSDNEGLTVPQVHSLLAVLCDETEIAEVDLEMGEFSLKVRRAVDAVAAPAPVAAAPPAPVAAPAPAAPAAPAASPLESVEEEDEALVDIVAPKVGVLRRSRMVKGKAVGKGTLVTEGDSVKKGQVLCFVEQLGTQTPIESTTAGEISGFLVEDGGPVEYQQALVQVRPFFGGHIIGDSKHA